MTDPYLVLGVGHSASDEDVKKAYRQMCKQYHPDLNPNNPAAEEKFKEVQAAYEEIMRQRTGGGSSNSSYYGSAGAGGYQQQRQSGGYGRSYGYREPFSGFGGFGGFGFDDDFFGGQRSQSTDWQNESSVMQAARNYINARHYSEALNALNMVDAKDRDARWYYYSALANAGMGNNINALEHAHRAAQMEPNNLEYQQLLQQLQGGSYNYQQRSQNYNQPAFEFGGCCRAWVFLQMLSCCCGGGRC